MFRNLARRLPDGVTDLIVTLGVTLLVTLGLIEGIAALTHVLARGNWQLARAKSTTKRRVLSMLSTLAPTVALPSSPNGPPPAGAPVRPPSPSATTNGHTNGTSHHAPRLGKAEQKFLV